MTTSIPYTDFGGDGPLIHFAHANGYPPLCYRQMIAPLLDDYRVLAMAQRPLWPGSRPEELNDWHLFAEDMIRFFDEMGWKEVIGVGHSLGAVATMVASIRRPELFRALVLIEPVFLPPAVLQALPLVSDLSHAGHLPLVKTALKRRRRWPNRQAAFERFRQKEIFARWSDEALWDYVAYGLRPDETGEVVLAFPPEWEAQIYARPPRDVWEWLPQVRQPTLAIRGAETDTLVPAAWQLWQSLQPEATFVEIPGVGHLMPMERPETVAQAILAFLNAKTPGRQGFLTASRLSVLASWRLKFSRQVVAHHVAPGGPVVGHVVAP